MGVLLVVLVVTGGKQSQLLVRLTWTGMDLDWSLTTMTIKTVDVLAVFYYAYTVPMTVDHNSFPPNYVSSSQGGPWPPLPLR